MTRIAIALGANIGDAAGHINAAFERLQGFVDEARLSPLYGSAPMYVVDQPRFVNAVAIGKTALKPRELLGMLKAIEVEMGREITMRNGPRLIDLDILFYGDDVIAEPDLQIPHARMAERPFVLVPLCDLAPDWTHPRTGQSARAMLGALNYGERDLHALAG